jgi:threonine/homoserine/homoserine lactone efflux protein
MRDPLLFGLAVAAILGVPGPTNTLLAAAGASVGFRRAARMIPAEAAGYLIAICALGFALGPVVAGLPAVTAALRLAVACYLFLLAWRLWRQGAAATALARAPVGPGQLFLATLLNPKALVFAFGIIPFGSPDIAAYLAGFLALAATAALFWVGLGAALGRVAEGMGRRALIPRVGAIVMGGFATMLATSIVLR